MTNKDPLQRLSQALKELRSVEPKEGFDERFWKKFELETSPMPVAAPSLSFSWLGALSAIVAVAAIAIFILIPLDEPHISMTQGMNLLKNKQILKVGDRLQTNSASWLVFELEKGYRVKLEPNSEITVQKLKKKWWPGKSVFKLNKGQVLVSIGDQVHRKYPFEVMTPNAFARAMGTQFMVSAPSLNSPGSKISVLKGTVKVGSAEADHALGSSAIDVHQGFETSVNTNQSPEKPQALLDRVKRQLEESFQFSQTNRAILLISMSPNRVKELLKPCGIYIRFEHRTPAVIQIEEITKKIIEAQDKKDEVAHLIAVREMENVVMQNKDVESTSLLLFIGAYYHYLKEYVHAIRLFDEVVNRYPDSSMASLALMAKADILKNSLNDNTASEQIYKQILTSYPDSPESQSLQEAL